MNTNSGEGAEDRTPEEAGRTLRNDVPLVNTGHKDCRETLEESRSSLGYGAAEEDDSIQSCPRSQGRHRKSADENRVADVGVEDCHREKDGREKMGASARNGEFAVPNRRKTPSPTGVCSFRHRHSWLDSHACEDSRYHL